MTNSQLSLFKEYLLLEKKLSKNSVDAYCDDVAKFLDFVEKNNPDNDLTKISPQNVQAFLAKLYDMGLNRSSQQRIVSGVKSFFNFLVLTKKIETSPFRLISMPKSERPLPNVLSVEEVFAMLESVDLSTQLGHRNRAILELMYSSGLRVSEVCNIKIRDVLFDDALIKVTGKGDKNRIIPVGEIALKQIKLYLQTDADHDGGVLFVSRQGGQITRAQIFNIVKKVASNANITKKISPHTLRHCFASHLLANGANLRIIQALLGHESISTTEIYTHLEIKQLKEAVDLLPVKLHQ